MRSSPKASEQRATIRTRRIPLQESPAHSVRSAAHLGRRFPRGGSMPPSSTRRAPRAGIEIEVKARAGRRLLVQRLNVQPFSTSYWGGASDQDQMYSTAYLSQPDWNDTRFKRPDLRQDPARSAFELDEAKRKDMYPHHGDDVRRRRRPDPAMFNDFVNAAGKRVKGYVHDIGNDMSNGYVGPGYGRTPDDGKRTDHGPVVTDATAGETALRSPDLSGAPSHPTRPRRARRQRSGALRLSRPLAALDPSAPGTERRPASSRVADDLRRIEAFARRFRHHLSRPVGDAAGPVENIRKDLGLDRPWSERYIQLARGAVQGDFGTSWASRNSVSERSATARQLALPGFLRALAPYRWRGTRDARGAIPQPPA